MDAQRSQLCHRLFSARASSVRGRVWEDCKCGKELRNSVCCLGELMSAGQSLSAVLLSCVFKGVCEVGGALSFPFLLAQLGTTALTSRSLGWHQKQLRTL